MLSLFLFPFTSCLFSPTPQPSFPSKGHHATHTMYSCPAMCVCVCVLVDISCNNQKRHVSLNFTKTCLCVPQTNTKKKPKRYDSMAETLRGVSGVSVVAIKETHMHLTVEPRVADVAPYNLYVNLDPQTRAIASWNVHIYVCDYIYNTFWALQRLTTHHTPSRGGRRERGNLIFIRKAKGFLTLTKI